LHMYRSILRCSLQGCVRRQLRMWFLTVSCTVLGSCGLVESNTEDGEQGAPSTIVQKEPSDKSALDPESDSESVGGPGVKGDGVDGEVGQGVDGTPCGKPAQCLPGKDFCHPELGRITACNECGFPEESTDVRCVRSFSTDKESGLLCAIYGESEMYCAGVSWPPQEVYELPKDVAKFAMVDDSAVYLNRLSLENHPYCVLTFDGAVRCSGLQLSGGDAELLDLLEKRDDCTKVVPVNQMVYSMCAICGNDMFCTGGKIEAFTAGATDVDGGDGMFYWLIDGVLYRRYEGKTAIVGWRSVELGNAQQVCGLTLKGGIACDRSGYTPDLVEQIEGDFLDVELNDWPSGTGLEASGAVRGFDFEKGSETYRLEGPFVEIEGSVLFTCARTLVGELTCWDLQGKSIEILNLPSVKRRQFVPDFGINEPKSSSERN